MKHHEMGGLGEVPSTSEKDRSNKNSCQRFWKIYDEIMTVYGSGTPLYDNGARWKRNFQTSQISVTDDPKSGTTRGLLATDHVILNHGQVTWTTPELAPPPNYHTTPTEDVSALDRFNVHRCPTRRVFSGLDRTHDMPAMVGYLNHWATAAHPPPYTLASKS
ncbi:uncharacterized protein TNCV_3129651 [Trichonephila clavipes]|nr:uncharacterized protein TNCV_3129651 [Trichonephila clavipes]